jgi:hypothetical protein
MKASEIRTVEIEGTEDGIHARNSRGGCMSKIVQTEVFNISELSEEAREKAINDNRDWNTLDSFWYEPLLSETFPEMAEAKGFEIGYRKNWQGEYRDRRIYFSGFWSQGDGASFEASVNYEDFILKNRLGNRYRTLLNHVKRDGGGCSIDQSGLYSHKYTMHIADADRYFSPYDDTERAYRSAEKADEQCDELLEDILETARDLADEFYRMLEQAHDHLTSDEEVEESLLVNEVEFTASGERF